MGGLVAFECDAASFSVRSVCGADVILDKVVYFPDKGGSRQREIKQTLPAGGLKVVIGKKGSCCYSDWRDGYETWTVYDSLPFGHGRLTTGLRVVQLAVCAPQCI